MQRNGIIFLVLLWLAACGGGGGDGGGAGIDPRLARLDIYEAQKRRVLGDPGAGVAAMPMTASNDVPTDGALVFAGSASMRVETGVQPIVIFGDADLRVDFAQGTAQGLITNTFGTISGAGWSIIAVKSRCKAMYRGKTCPWTMRAH